MIGPYKRTVWFPVSNAVGLEISVPAATFILEVPHRSSSRTGRGARERASLPAMSRQNDGAAGGRQADNPFEDFLASPPLDDGSREYGSGSGNSNPFEDPFSRPSGAGGSSSRYYGAGGMDSFLDDDDEYKGRDPSGPAFQSSANTAMSSQNASRHGKRASRGSRQYFGSYAAGGETAGGDDPLTKAAAMPAGFSHDRKASGSYRLDGDKSYGQDYDNDEAMDDLDQIDDLSWDYAAGGAIPVSSDENGGYAPGHGRAGARARGGLNPRALLRRARQVDWTLGLGRGSLSDVKHAFGSKLSSSAAADTAGEPRTIYLNDDALNGQGRGAVKGTPNQGKRRWEGNSVSTSKYNIVTFVPKFLIGERARCCYSFRSGIEHVARQFADQFSRYANLFFLFTGECLET